MLFKSRFVINKDKGGERVAVVWFLMTGRDICPLFPGVGRDICPGRYFGDGQGTAVCLAGPGDQ